ncbi:MAG: pyrroloquinoline quinone biosynthesis protein C, partial [Rhizobiales bacterium]|nr:pyrroloquinoline quinone biosynthesis protein C [Hyphomicrobiales bacterium]
VLEYATTAALQKDALDALTFKCNVLWSQLDALYLAYYSPALIPPGAFREEDAN